MVPGKSMHAQPSVQDRAAQKFFFLVRSQTQPLSRYGGKISCVIFPKVAERDFSTIYLSFIVIVIVDDVMGENIM